MMLLLMTMMMKLQLLWVGSYFVELLSAKRVTNGAILKTSKSSHCEQYVVWTTRHIGVSRLSTE